MIKLTQSFQPQVFYCTLRQAATEFLSRQIVSFSEDYGFFRIEIDSFRIDNDSFSA